MSTAIATTMSIQEFLALPEDGLERQLIRGQLKERPMTYRNRFHSQVVARIAALLSQWNDRCSGTHDQVHAGDVGCILRRDPDTAVGIDVAYFSTEVVQRQSPETTVMEGSPQLAVQVLSPSDKMEDVRDKVREYLAAGVALVWIVDPYFHTVTVHQPAAPPRMFNDQETLSGGSTLPGLEIAVADLFGGG
jgi:Uma2 family endonuclease